MVVNLEVCFVYMIVDNFKVLVEVFECYVGGKYKNVWFVEVFIYNWVWVI